MASKIIISLVLGCALLGGYASMFSSYRYGYLDALRVCTSNATPPGDGPCALDMSDSLTRSITGFPPVDDLINVLLEFFSQGLRRAPGVQGIDLEAFLAFAYLATQFGGAWYIIALEGLRRGNKGTILSWTGTFGITFQAVTITIIAPIYLTLQLLGSPSIVPDPEALLVDPHELNLLPLSAVVTYLVPSAGLCLPLIRQIPGETKLLAVALWQPFPLYHSAVQGLGKLLRGSGGGSDAGKASTSTSVATYRKALSRANSFITALTVSVHVAVVGIMVASVTSDLVSPVSAHHVLALTSLTEPPMTAMQNPPVSLLDSREIVVSFLRWDVYCTCASLLIWSAYQLYAIRRGTFGIVFKALFYLLVGGPIFPSMMLLWERDETALRTLEHARQGQKAGGMSQQRGANGSTSKGKRRT